MGNIKGKRVLASLVCLLIAFLVLYGLADKMLPNEIALFRGETSVKRGLYSIEIRSVDTDAVEAFNSSGNTVSRYQTDATLKLFGVLPLKTVQVNVYGENTLIPGGMPFGVKLHTKGVVVVGLSQIQENNRSRSPAGEAGIEKGDIILTINGKSINKVEEISKELEKSEGRLMELGIERNGHSLKCTLKPALCSVENRYKCGMWIRDSTAGIGTVTFIKPDTLTFGGLGHGICDADTGVIMPLLRGNVISVRILDIVRGSAGTPGELKGSFDGAQIGSLFKNTERGVFGTLNTLPSEIQREGLPIGSRDELKTGDVQIYTTLDADGVRAYNAKIEKIIDRDATTKNFIVHITDPELLKATGGIVQGMSGSPIIQNGKIVGAITHVLINDPTRGYGIMIENMLDASQDTQAQSWKKAS